MKAKKIEAEGSELILRNEHGDYAIIPKKHKLEVSDMVKEGCNKCIDAYVDLLPIMNDYAQDGSVVKSKNSQFVTKLNEQEEKEFNDWYQKVSRFKELNPDPDSKEQYYDYRGYWKNEKKDDILKDKNLHFTDKYKQPGHPTFSNESIYSNDETPGGSWNVDKKGIWYFIHSNFTEKYKEKTDEYLKGSGEYAITTKNDTIKK